MRFSPGCNCCGGGTGTPCEHCTSTPAEMSVTTSGMADGVNPGEACPCPLGDGTFVCAQTSACQWNYGYPSCTADDTYNNRDYEVQITVIAKKIGSDYITEGQIAITIIGGPPYPTGMVNSGGTFRYNHGTTKPNCSTFSGLTLAFVSHSGGCDFSSVTFQVTAL